MLRVESNTQLAGFTEFEEDILFDQDDPDFDGVTSLSAVPVMLKGEWLITITVIITTADLW